MDPWWRKNGIFFQINLNYIQIIQSTYTLTELNIETSQWAKLELRPTSDSLPHISPIGFNELSSCEVRRLNWAFEVIGIWISKQNHHSNCSTYNSWSLKRLKHNVINKPYRHNIAHCTCNYITNNSNIYKPV